MTRIPNNLRERAIGMLDAGMSTEYIARHVGCSSRAIRNLRVRFRTTQEVPTTYHVVDVRVLQSLVKTAIAQTRICAIYSTATAANTHGLYNNRISVQTTVERFTCTASLRRMRYTATSSSKSS